MAERIRLIAGGAESPKERIERLVAGGSMPLEAVEQAESLWRDRLHRGIPVANGRTAQLSLDDLYPLIVDPRIWRWPERIERLLAGIFEIRTAELGRQLALSRWQEWENQLCGYAILLPDDRVWTLHLISENDIAKRQRKGELLWKC